MSDPVSFSEAQAGQPVTSFTPEEAQPQGNQEQPKMFSLTDVERIVEEKSEKAVLKALESFGKKQQSERDKLEKRIDSRLNNLKAYNVEITPEVKDRVAQEVFQETQAENSPNVLPSTEAQPKTNEPPVSDPVESTVNRMARELDQEYGTFIDDTDPEYQTLNGIKSKTEWLNRYEVALQAKAQRLSKTQPRSQPFIGGNNTPINPIANIVDRDQLWSEVRKKG